MVLAVLFGAFGVGLGLHGAGGPWIGIGLVGQCLRGELVVGCWLAAVGLSGRAAEKSGLCLLRWAHFVIADRASRPIRFGGLAFGSELGLRPQASGITGPTAYGSELGLRPHASGITGRLHVDPSSDFVLTPPACAPPSVVWSGLGLAGLVLAWLGCSGLVTHAGASGG